jgi:F-type H+-transporting ATPase subunit epsilon
LAEPFKFDLVAPDRLLVSEEVESVVVPGREGYFTVLARHAPLISTLKPGQIEVKAVSGGTQKFFVSGGFADVSPAGLTILADKAIPLESLGAEHLEAEISAAEANLAAAGEDHERRLVAETKLSELRDVQRWIIPA